MLSSLLLGKKSFFSLQTGRELQRCSVDAAVHALAVAWAVLHVGLANGHLLSYCLVRRRLVSGPRFLSDRPITCLSALPERQCLLAGAESDGIRVLSREGQVLRHIMPAERDLLPLAAMLCHGRVLTFHDCQLLCFDFDVSATFSAHLPSPSISPSFFLRSLVIKSLISSFLLESPASP